MALVNIGRGLSVDIDVTPDNWLKGDYSSRARIVHEWIAAGSTPEMLVDTARHFGLAELQAVTVSVQKPHVVFRMFVTEHRTAGEVADFAEKAKRSLATAFEKPRPTVTARDNRGTIFPEGL